MPKPDADELPGRPQDIPPSACPSCGALLEEAAGLEVDRPPRPGDLTICAYCLVVLQFSATRHLVALPPAQAGLALMTLDIRAAQDVLAAWAAEEVDR